MIIPGKKFNSRGERRLIEKHAHHLVVETAKGMAGAMYEALMKKNEWYDEWKRKNPGKNAKEIETCFILRTYGNLIDEARTTLTDMLSNPSIDALTKERIYDSLVLDKTLTRGRLSNQEIFSTVKGKTE